MLSINTIDDVVIALAEAPIDSRTGNRTLYSVNWIADAESMIGRVNPDWVRRELDWFNSGSNLLADMEGPVPQLFQACAGWDGAVNSAYGHILFSNVIDGMYVHDSLYKRAVDAFINEGLGTRHSIAIISDRSIHTLATWHDRDDFICTNALNFMVDDNGGLNIIAQMRSMDAVFGYRADYSMWDDLMKRMVKDLNSDGFPVYRGNITFQVANLHVYPRHFEMLADTAAGIQERLDRRVWAPRSDRDRAWDGASDGGRLG